MKSPFSEPSGLKRTSWKKYCPSPDSLDLRRKRAGMTRSVSMFGRSMGTAPDVSLLKASMALLLARERADVGEPARDGSGRGHGGAHEMRAGALALAPLEVAVGGGGDPLALAGGVAVHAHAHRATRIAPLEAGRCEHLVETLGLRGLLDESGAGHDPCLDHCTPALRYQSRGPQILDAAVGARADEHPVDLDLRERHAGTQAHVVDGAAHRLPPRGICLAGGIGHAPRDGQRVLRARAPRHGGGDIGAVERHLLVEDGVSIR